MGRMSVRIGFHTTGPDLNLVTPESMIWRLTLPSEVIAYLFKHMFRLSKLRADTWSFWQNDPAEISKILKFNINVFFEQKSQVWVVKFRDEMVKKSTRYGIAFRKFDPKVFSTFSYAILICRYVSWKSKHLQVKEFHCDCFLRFQIAYIAVSYFQCLLYRFLSATAFLIITLNHLCSYSNFVNYLNVLSYSSKWLPCIEKLLWRK